MLGIPVGIGFYTFVYAKGGSYMTNDPQACANCHIMHDHYDAWMKSSHHSVATCNDCHTPPGLIPKYVTKASNGFWHSYAFTTGDFHEPIQIKAHNLSITEQACRKCHSEIVDAIETKPSAHHLADSRSTEQFSCIKCHSTVGHME
jgi:cytochrome c nitrite reductase small subunit